MTVFDYLKAGAMSFISPPKKQMKNLEKPEYPNGNPYKDLNQDGEDPVLKPKKTKSALSFIHPERNTKDPSRDKRGHYITSMTYPLPPVSWEKRQYDKNRRMRNSKNNYL